MTNSAATSQECVRFLREIQLGGSHDFSATPFQHAGGMSNLYADATTIFLKVTLLPHGEDLMCLVKGCSVINLHYFFQNVLCRVSFFFCLDYRSSNLMLDWLLLANFWKNRKGCIQQLWNLILDFRMVELQIHQMMDTQMISKLKPTLISTKCFLVS